MSNFYDELKKTYCVDTYLQKRYIPVTIKRKYRKKTRQFNLFTEFSDIYRVYAKTRKKITGRKSFRLATRMHTVFALRLAYATIFCVVFLLNQYMSAFAGAVSVPREARGTAENAKLAAQAVIDADQAVLDKLNAEEYVEDAVMVVDDLKERIKEAERIFNQKCQNAEDLKAQAQAAADAADDAAAKAAQDKAAAAKALLAANSAAEYAQNLEEGAKLRISDISSAAAKKLDELDSREENVSEKQLKAVAEDALREIERLQAETEGSITAAYERADHLFEFADRLEAKADRSEREADEKRDAADLARDIAQQASDEANDAREVCADLLASLSEAKDEEQLARKDLADLIREQNNPQGSYYWGAGMNYYSWSDSQGYSGYQLVKPFFYGYSQKEYSYGLSASHINAGGSGPAGEDGSVSAFSDVTVSVEKRKETEKYLFSYGLDVNLPTGKATLPWSGRYATMSEDLVELGQFGKGWEFTPRLAVSKKINKKDTLTLATSYAFKGTYDPTADIPNDTITPGGEWRKNLRWQRAGQQWQFVGELIHTSSSPTKLSDGSSYPVSSYWEQRLTYNRKLNDTEDIMFYYWRENASSNEILPLSSSEAANNYLGTMWSKKLDDKRIFRLTFDVMRTNGNHYSHMTNAFDWQGNPQYTSVSVDGRTKYTLGAIYDYKINQDSKITAEIQKFTMKDGPATTGKPAANYNGINVFLAYSRSF